MRCLKIKDGVVINVELWKECPEGLVEAPEPDIGIGWTDNGDGTFSAPVVTPPVLSDEEKIAVYRAAVGTHIDQKAQSFGFDSIVTAVTYADEPADPLNQSYGQALRAWRSQCWEKCREVLATWQGGGAEPTVDELIAGLPVFVAP